MLYSLRSIVITLLSIWIRSHAKVLGPDSLPYTCNDGSEFGKPFNCAAAPDYPKDRRKDENTVRIMQFNADSLFLDGCASWNSFKPRVPTGKTTIGALSHLESVADIIYRMNADIVIIEEVCDCCVLRELIRYMHRNDHSQSYNEYLLPSSGPDAEYVGIITRVDPIDIWNIKSTPRLKPKKQHVAHSKASKLQKVTSSNGRNEKVAELNESIQQNLQKSLEVPKQEPHPLTEPAVEPQSIQKSVQKRLPESPQVPQQVQQPSVKPESGPIIKVNKPNVPFQPLTNPV